VHEIVLAFDAPDAVPDAGDVVLGQQLRAVEGRVLLLEDELLQVAAAARVVTFAAIESGIAGAPRQVLEDETTEARVVDRGVGAEVTDRPLEAELGSVVSADVALRIRSRGQTKVTLRKTPTRD
jgi:hypothetical protein